MGCLQEEVTIKIFKAKNQNQSFFQKMHFLAKDSHQRHIRIIVDESEPEDDSETPKNIHFLFFVSLCTSHFLHRTKNLALTIYPKKSKYRESGKNFRF